MPTGKKPKTLKSAAATEPQAAPDLPAALAEPDRDAKLFGDEKRINPAIDPSKSAEERLAALDEQHRVMRGG